MGMRAQIRAQSDASGTQKAQPPERSPARWDATDATKRQTIMGNYRPGPQNQQLNDQVNEGPDSVWKVKCLEEVGQERLSAQRRVEPQCESHSSQ